MNLLSGIGVAIVAAWLAVTNLAYVDEFTCTVPWSGDTDCNWPKINIAPSEMLVFEVYSVQHDGKEVGETAWFKIQDANNNNVQVDEIPVSPRTTVIWSPPNKDTPLVAQLRLNVHVNKTMVVRGRYRVKLK